MDDFASVSLSLLFALVLLLLISRPPTAPPPRTRLESYFFFPSRTHTLDSSGSPFFFTFYNIFCTTSLLTSPEGFSLLQNAPVQNYITKFASTGSRRKNEKKIRQQPGHRHCHTPTTTTTAMMTLLVPPRRGSKRLRMTRRMDTEKITSILHLSLLLCLPLV